MALIRRLYLFSMTAACLSTLLALVVVGGVAKRMAFMLSIWSLLGVCAYFCIALAYSGSSPRTSMTLLQRIALSQAVPLCTVTCLGFWVVCGIDRDLLYPEALGSMHTIFNHAIHTLPGVLMIAEWIHYGRLRLNPGNFVPMLYVFASAIFAVYSGTWLYK